MPSLGDAASTARQIKALLDSTRASLLGTLVDDLQPGDLSPTDYDRFLAQQKQVAINDALEQLEGRALAVADDSLRVAAQNGVDDVSVRIGKLSVATTPIGVDVGVLAMVQDLAGSQIKVALEEVKGKVKVAMSRAMAGGLSFSELQREVSEAFNGDITQGRIDKIIRTETVRSYSQAQAAADEQLADGPVGEELIKRWKIIGDGRARPEHAIINGQERELDELFNVGGGATATTPPDSKLGFKANGPADPSLPAELAVNCRCTVIYVNREQAKQDYIAKARAA